MQRIFELSTWTVKFALISVYEQNKWDVSFHDTVTSAQELIVIIILHEIFRQNHTHISYLQIKLKVFVNHLYSRIIERESNYNNT